MAFAGAVPTISASVSVGGFRIGSGIGWSAVATKSIMRLPTRGTVGRFGMGTFVKNGCANRCTTVSRAVPRDRVPVFLAPRDEGFFVMASPRCGSDGRCESGLSYAPLEACMLACRRDGEFAATPEPEVSVLPAAHVTCRHAGFFSRDFYAAVAIQFATASRSDCN